MEYLEDDKPMHAWRKHKAAEGEREAESQGNSKEAGRDQ